MTLLHGDAHIGNSYVLPGDDVGFLDWQVTRRGEWSQDVGYFLISALTDENRRKHEADLLDEYRKSLRVSHDQRPTADQMWTRYRATPILIGHLAVHSGGQTVGSLGKSPGPFAKDSRRRSQNLLHCRRCRTWALEP